MTAPDAARQLKLLVALSRCAPGATGAAEVCAAILAVLRAEPGMFPAPRLYLLDAETNQLRDESADEEAPALDASDEPFAQALRTRAVHEADGTTVVPIAGEVEPRVLGVLLIGMPTISASPDAGARRDFLELAAAQIASQLGRAELRAAQGRAHQSQDEFLATMSHELRTPLSAILGWATMLKRDHKDDAKVERGLAIIERHARAQAGLIDELIDTSRILTGKVQLTPRAIDLNEVVRAATDVSRPAASARGVELRLALSPAPSLLLADPDRLHQALWHLLSNAIRFSSAGQVIEVRTGRSETEVVMRVKDSGLGIAREQLPRLFERFWRAGTDSSSSPQKGFGLGLANVRHLIEAHGGTVAGTSEGKGKGATFTVTLPIGAAPAEVERLFALGEAPRKRSARLDGIRVLLVDDDDDALELVRLLLQAEGASVTSVGSAKEALLREGPFQIIISDIGMPGVDGYTMMRLFRERGVQTPGIALTVYARKQDTELAHAAGYQEHFAKPVDDRSLIAAIERLTG